MVRHIHIGTSGWSYQHWKNDFYPKGVQQKVWLHYYAQYFNSTEINGSFYRLPSAETLVSWINSVPDHFLFCPKMSRFLTHMKKLRDPEEPLERFFSIFEPMKMHMGPVLIQLPPMLAFHYEVAAHFFELLKRKYSEFEFVLEVRHSSWLQDIDTLSLLTQYQIGFVLSQSGNQFPYAEMQTAKNIYVRFHGPQALYASSYTDDELNYFAHKFLDWEKEGYIIWAYFNNDIHGYAPKDAIRLRKLCNV